MSQIFIASSQMALFFKRALDRPENVWQDVMAKTGDILDATPLIIPIPQDAPLIDVPVVQMSSADKKWACNIARGRSDFFINDREYSELENVKNDLIEKTKILFRIFSPQEIKRIGFVTRFFVDNADGVLSIAKVLSENFKKQHAGQVHETYVRYVTRTKYDAVDLNDFTTIEEGKRQKDKAVFKGVLVTRDFNTAPEIDYSAQLDENFSEKFISNSSSKFKLDEIINCL